MAYAKVLPVTVLSFLRQASAAVLAMERAEGTDVMQSRVFMLLLRPLAGSCVLSL